MLLSFGFGVSFGVSFGTSFETELFCFFSCFTSFLLAEETPKPKENNNPTPSQKPSSQPQNGGETTKLYDSITGGKKEFATDSEANARGAEIKSKELDYVLDYNEQHPEAPIKPDIRYYRVYPVIDEEGTGYYLHFFCESGEGNDAKLKSMY